ncbi:MAG: hypothetical protein HQ567_28640 [Candidatus Nealsonbacteria bacterium]|nr:hypothetical protein [Candidatus Nealsonbacteria bacterium]
MPIEKPNEKIAITVELPQQVALRLKSAATNQNRPATDVVVALLDRHLPRLQAEKKGTIPYM